MEEFIFMLVVSFLYIIVVSRKDILKIIRKWDEPFEKKDWRELVEFIFFLAVIALIMVILTMSYETAKDKIWDFLLGR